jgi:hypothetical protein
MEKTTLSVYRYLTFLLPGALVLATAVYGWSGWPYGEPGAGALLGLSTAAYVSGHVVVSIANIFQRVWWLQPPGGRLKSSQGLFDKSGRYADSKDEVTKAFSKAYPQVSDFEAQFGIAYQEAQKGPLASKLLAFVEEIGYQRSMATASAICIVLAVIFHLAGHRHLPIELWLPVFFVSTVAHAYRFRRFWRYVAEYVTGEVLLKKASSQEPSADA